jgi:hypothetical protein
MGDTSEKFVRSLKEKLEKIKNLENLRRNILSDTLDFISFIINDSSTIEIREIRDYQTSEISCFLNLYSDSDDILSSIKEILIKNNLDYRTKELNPKKSLFLVNVGENLISSGNKEKWCFLEFDFRGKHIFDLKITVMDDSLSYSIFDKNYYKVDVWVCDDLNIETYNIQLRSANRDKDRLIVDMDPRYKTTLKFDGVGEIEKINISKKRGGKIKTDTIITKI